MCVQIRSMVPSQAVIVYLIVLSVASVFFMYFNLKEKHSYLLDIKSSF